MQRYSFPILKLQEIKDCMDELRIDVRIEDLREPKGEVLKRIYEMVRPLPLPGAPCIV